MPPPATIFSENRSSQSSMHGWGPPIEYRVVVVPRFLFGQEDAGTTYRNHVEIVWFPLVDLVHRDEICGESTAILTHMKTECKFQ
jgi:hypothetical protein